MLAVHDSQCRVLKMLVNPLLLLLLTLASSGVNAPAYQVVTSFRFSAVWVVDSY
jgi:hypothetical protein